MFEFYKIKVYFCKINKCSLRFKHSNTKSNKRSVQTFKQSYIQTLSSNKRRVQTFSNNRTIKHFQTQMYKYILICSLIFTILSCDNDIKRDNISKNQAQIETAKEVEILYSDSAVVRIKITSPVLLSHLERENPHDEFPQGVRLDFFDEKQQATSVLTSKYGLRFPLKNQVILRDSCVWHSVSNQETLEGFELIWDENLQKVHSNKLVIITTPTEKIWGYGFETNKDFTHWKINKPQGRLAVEKIE